MIYSTMSNKKKCSGFGLTLLFPLTPEMETFAHIEETERKNGCNLQKPGFVH